MNAEFLLGPTGGLAYHARAWRSRQTHWKPFLNAVRSWLSATWNPKENELLIFGTSAGWTLPLDFLMKFDRLIIVEPDFIGRSLFRFRIRLRGYRGKIVSNSSSTALPWFQPKNFRSILSSYPDAAILFANLLGQIPLLRPMNKGSLAEKEFLASLEKRNWASYHDILSASFKFLPESIRCPERLENENLADLAGNIFSRASCVIDHETIWMSENRETQLSLWRLRADQIHLIGFVCSAESKKVLTSPTK